MIKVQFKESHGGFKKGEIKKLTLQYAQEVISKGIADEVKEVRTGENQEAKDVLLEAMQRDGKRDK